MNLALYSNRITPDRGLVHGYSNRSDMNAGISAHFSPTLKRERDKWFRFVHTHHTNLNPSEKFGGCGQSISLRNVFQEHFTLRAFSWLNSYNYYGRSSL